MRSKHFFTLAVLSGLFFLASLVTLEKAAYDFEERLSAPVRNNCLAPYNPVCVDSVDRVPPPSFEAAIFLGLVSLLAGWLAWRERRMSRISASYIEEMIKNSG